MITIEVDPETKEWVVPDTLRASIWYCKAGHEPVATIGQQEPCPVCGGEMSTIGWMES